MEEKEPRIIPMDELIFQLNKLHNLLGHNIDDVESRIYFEVRLHSAPNDVILDDTKSKILKELF